MKCRRKRIQGGEGGMEEKNRETENVRKIWREVERAFNGKKKKKERGEVFKHTSCILP